ncbi:GntR family transcriptional regulator [Brevibacillus reuszeri]|uniref:GntR family transcriptional regulator n=1 Tax=Brevibacillus reuszeri TaxID=54915 RepID=A0A0K9YTP1_9BACL|nr:FadR/GntR family transcriptional regulator [Brevibacillus reuszeri]KNB71565.1 GntR family transcriptional regulator [Brevibacillus reuszeri]MED1855622.1 FadR/GntR family transcriptional regulator [Brevibacillus reuszeri]GED67228.1 GntR family transcriptional regulator [Brevibacillus reuszeri]
MDLSRLAKKNHYEHITEQLKQLILSGELQPGAKLPSTKELSEQFGVGRSTTREALSALKAMGLIDIRQGGNCTVKSVPSSGQDFLPDLQNLLTNKETILELLEARKSLEVSNAALASLKRDEQDLIALEQILQEMALHAGDEEIGERTDLLFHLTLAKATHNSIMVRLFETISAQMEIAIRETRRVEIYSNRSVSEQFYSEHQALFAAIRDQQPEQAQIRMKDHLLHVETILMKYLTD